MPNSNMADYPRPDFVRENLRWESLNGPWSFIFDDNDVGLIRKYHVNGIPDTYDVLPYNTNSVENIDTSKESELEVDKEVEQSSGRSKDPTIKTYKKREIHVPYVFQCSASGINEQGVHEVLWYERMIEDPRESHETRNDEHRVLLRFGAVDYEAKVWIGGHLYGEHRGGHVPFDVDITEAFQNSTGPQRLVIRVYDSAHDLTQPRGKQYWKAKPESIFYTPSSGIWQNVWLEAVPSARIGDSSSGTLLQSNDIENGELHANIKVLGRLAGHRYTVRLDVRLNDIPVSQMSVELPRDSATAVLTANMRLSGDQMAKQPSQLSSNSTCWLNNVALWSPEQPTLYDITITLLSAHSDGNHILDTITTTTGMRSLHWDASTFRLNNRPYFQALFLDQGYWPSTFMTPPSSSALAHDIHLSKAMGFNGCRKHQKVEDPVFLYWADKLGFLVWGEMASAYAFSCDYAERFDQEWKEAVLRDRNHPSVIAWTTVNESWAYTDLTTNTQQRDHIRSLYYATKVLDPTRPVNDNCGWEHVKTDLTTFHDYADADELTTICSSLEGILKAKSDRPTFVSAIGTQDPGAEHQPGAPILCTEFGGINIARENAVKEPGKDQDWGYTTATDSNDLLKRIEKMMNGIVEGGLICGFVYTQLTDIEQEVNGLYTPDRKEKLDAKEVKRIVDGVKKRYEELHN